MRMAKKAERLRIRCEKETFIRFKKLAVEIGTYENTLRLLMDFYEEWSKARIAPQVK